jgi:hypothetical protein
MNYTVVYEVGGRKITLGSYKSKISAEKRLEKEKKKGNYGKNGFHEYLTINRIITKQTKK